LKHPLHKASKKSRNIISGLLVCVAAIYAVSSYFDIPQSEINAFFVGSAFLVLGIITLAVITVLLIKGLQKISSLISRSEHK
jgi:hypothetical protein